MLLHFSNNNIKIICIIKYLRWCQDSWKCGDYCRLMPKYIVINKLMEGWWDGNGPLSHRTWCQDSFENLMSCALFLFLISSISLSLSFFYSLLQLRRQYEKKPSSKPTKLKVAEKRPFPRKVAKLISMAHLSRECPTRLLSFRLLVYTIIWRNIKEERPPPIKLLVMRCARHGKIIRFCIMENLLNLLTVY